MLFADVPSFTAPSTGPPASLRHKLGADVDGLALVGDNFSGDEGRAGSEWDWALLCELVPFGTDTGWEGEGCVMPVRVTLGSSSSGLVVDCVVGEGTVDDREETEEAISGVDKGS